MSPAAKPRDQRLVLGGVPRAELLPPELKQEATASAQRRVMVLLIVLALVVTGGATFGASVLAAQSAAELEQANGRTTEILLEQGKYAEARQLAARVSASEDAGAIVMATDIDWVAQLALIDATAASVGATVDNTAVTQSTAFAVVDEPADLLEKPRVATVVLTATTPTLPNLADWLEAFEALPGFAGVTFGTATLTGLGYDTVVTVHFDESIFTNRFAETTDEESNE